MRVVGILVNYRTADLTLRALRSLLAELERVGVHRVVVVDNDSQDGSFERLRAGVAGAGWDDRATVVASPHNGGYGYGINLAVRHALAAGMSPDYFYVLNTDAFPGPGTVARLAAFLDAHPDGGVASGRIHASDGTTQGGAFRFPSLLGELEAAAGLGLLTRLLARRTISIMPLPAISQPVDWLSGASMLIRRAVLEAGILFDERYFLYFEEVDFARRLRGAGWRCYFVADAPVEHLDSASTGLADQSRRLPRYWFASRHRYYFTHHGRTYAAATDLVWIAGYLLLLAKRSVTGRPAAVRARLLRDFVRASVLDLLVPPPDRGDGPADQRRLLDLLAEDLATHGGDLGAPGFWAVTAHRVGRRVGTLPPGPVRRSLDLTYRALFTGVDWLWEIQLPRSVDLGRRVRLGERGIQLRARAIGDDVRIHHDTTLGPMRLAEEDALPSIEDGAEIGSGAAVLGRVTVGAAAVVAPNSVVITHVPAGRRVLGVPAREIVE